jgi:magnesium chelatase family protein
VLDHYRARISGPLLDRIDLQVDVPPLTLTMLDAFPDVGDSSAAVRARVVAARAFGTARMSTAGYCRDATPGGGGLHSFAFAGDRGVAPDGLAMLRQALVTQSLGGRGFARALAVARTIADLDGVAKVSADHVAEALAFRVRGLLGEVR